jgi:predicted O-linked N-acetylglucosamine transferase (SPINDLY family)
MTSDNSAAILQQLFDRAVSFLQQGNLAEADRHCMRVLAVAPTSFQVLSLLGVIRAQQGRNTEALALLGDALKIKPHATAALLNYGNVLQALGRDEEALACCDKVLEFEVNHAGALYNRGNLLLRLKRWDDALASYAQVLAAQPDFAEAWNNHGLALHGLRRCEEALTSYDRALAIKPDHVEAFVNRGASLCLLGRLEEALASYDRALVLRPDHAEAWYGRGVTMRDMGRMEDALVSYDRAVAARPDHAEAWHNRGNALMVLKSFSDAVASFDRALALNPGNAEALHNRGMCLSFLNRVDDALASYDQALAIRPDYADALHSRGMVRWREGRDYAAAVQDLEKTMALNPDHDCVQGDLLHVRMHGTDWSGFDETMAQINAGVRAGRLVIDPFMYLAIAESPADLQACAATFTRHFHPPAPALWKKSDRRREKIRIGYVSGEFRAQATAYLTAGLYECHDRNRFEIFAFDTGPAADSPMRRRLETAFDRFIRIADLSDSAAAQTILNAEVDILVSLNGYFGNHRMGIFAQRPAPLQVNFLGFPGTLGADYIDYILADRFVIPESDERHYTEKVVTLPGSYQVNDARRHRPQGMPGRAEHGLPETGFVFCNFNMSYKFTPEMFAVWMRILKQVEGSVLWLLEGNAAAPANLKRAAERHGVAADRLVFAPFIPMEQQLDRLPLADLFLDSVPCNAHTTASDALWAGVLLLTCRGTAFSGRVAASLLNAVGLPELVTETLDDYAALAVALAADPVRLQALRRKLADNLQTAPLFDTDRYRRHLEAAYAQMWERFARGEAPRGFTVTPGT